MNLPPLVPPLKCQGIKTKLVGEIKRLADTQEFDRWIEPFCGSCVVALNVQPKRALLSDSNVHIIRLYREIQSGDLTPASAKAFLVEEGEKLRTIREPHFYAVRERFNARPTSLDFLFLNRSCFNGVMRFNRYGKFNVPYGHKPERFAQAYVTKIINQIRRIAEVVSACDWTFAVADFRPTRRMPDGTWTISIHGRKPMKQNWETGSNNCRVLLSFPRGTATNSGQTP
jgi:DNA adenine methylase